MTRTLLIAAIALLASSAPAPAQTTPARDGEVRVAYSELDDTTQVWLTLEPRTPDGKVAPPGTILTFTGRFKGKRPAGPVTDVEVRANVGLLWAPRPELWVALDGEDKIDFGAQVPPAGVNAGAMDYAVATVPVATLERIANARRVTGSVLGLEVEFTDAQREAVRAFIARLVAG